MEWVTRERLAPQPAGLYAISLGLSVTLTNDHETLRHGLVMYDPPVRLVCTVAERNTRLATRRLLIGFVDSHSRRELPCIAY
jgi:hypothetical protein